jgi:hypothetical protein
MAASAQQHPPNAHAPTDAGMAASIQQHPPNAHAPTDAGMAASNQQQPPNMHAPFYFMREQQLLVSNTQPAKLNQYTCTN